jgi:hypothetical protein
MICFSVDFKIWQLNIAYYLEEHLESGKMNYSMTGETNAEL